MSDARRASRYSTNDPSTSSGTGASSGTFDKLRDRRQAQGPARAQDPSTSSGTGDKLRDRRELADECDISERSSHPDPDAIAGTGHGDVEFAAVQLAALGGGLVG